MQGPILLSNFAGPSPRPPPFNLHFHALVLVGVATAPTLSCARSSIPPSPFSIAEEPLLAEIYTASVQGGDVLAERGAPAPLASAGTCGRSPCPATGRHARRASMRQDDLAFRIRLGPRLSIRTV